MAIVSFRYCRMKKVMNMELKRTIYKKLLMWKSERTGKVLELQGARQVGKTYILKKFAKENFKHWHYISMAEESGKDFLNCLEEAAKWTPGTPRPEYQALKEAFRLYDPKFTDGEDTVIIIDEIQESARVYNQIRILAREFESYVIVTGSYLGKILQKEFFLPAGDTDKLQMGTLSFEEFVSALGEEETYRNTELYGGSEISSYEKLKEYFDIYQKIGGYPEVVSYYVEHQNIQKCEDMIGRVMDIFTRESIRYFTDITDVQIFSKLFQAIAILMLREKQGVRELTTELSKIMYQEESGRTTKIMVNRAISWLQESHIIGYASKSTDCDYLQIKDNCRYYFLDLGIASYFLKMTGAEPRQIKGLLAENYVYLCLYERMQKRREIAGNAPWFALYQKTKGELDFFVRSLVDYKNYGIEVKSTDAAVKTAKRLLEDGKLDYLYLLKGDTKGGISEDGKIYAVPLYLADRIKFNMGES